MSNSKCIQKCILICGFAGALAASSLVGANTLVGVSMNPAPANDPGFNVFSNPTVILQQMDPATQITFTFTNTTPLTVGTEAYGKIAVNGFLAGYMDVPVASVTQQQFQVTTTISALLAAMDCNGNTSCNGVFQIGWGDDENPNFFTDSMLINLQYQ